MTAPRGSMSDEESSSGGSDAEELARCREAAVPAWGVGQRPRGPEKKRAGRGWVRAVWPEGVGSSPGPRGWLVGRRLGDSTSFRELQALDVGRFMVPFGETEAPECLLTQLPWASHREPPPPRNDCGSRFLDSHPPLLRLQRVSTPRGCRGASNTHSITISEAVKEPTKAEVQKATPEDDGFRLFFTSVPEGPEETAAPQPRRKRLPSRSSSEDSDEEWQRCQEAAVSASAILQESAIHGPVEVEKEAKKKKRKLKKKAKKEASTDLTTATTITSKATAGKQGKESAKLNGDLVSLGTKKKKRKKKAKRAIEASPFPLSKSAAAASAH
ncbi:uncharacterized protein C12orf43 homolog [Myotis lucifugus]|uniref:uncharacterized protein C12orf43 homolog n=1 Tax=Myotis lucifugus TaxID=59463 RepID=UPI000CCC00C2|nr:uncharacterized protein C12orf43 homolog [Myotis lucifugus]